MLVEAGSPWAYLATDLYHLIADNGHDPAVWLAIAAREHGYGTNRDSVLWRNDTHSWTNARSVRDPRLTGWELITDAKRQSQYVKYRDVYDSLIDGMYRITDPTYRYVQEQRTTLGGVFGIWTEDPGPYTDFVVAKINAYIQRDEGAMAGDDARFQWLEEQAGEIGYPKGTRGRNGKTIELLVLHITIGHDSLGYLRGANGNSAHYLTETDCLPRAQMVREADAAWAAGHRDYNLRGIQLEVEKRQTSTPWTNTMYVNLAETCLPIARRNRIPLVYLGKDNGTGKRGFIGHSDVPDPNDPGLWGGDGNHTDPGANFDWGLFINLMRQLDGDTVPVPSGPPAMPQTVPDPNGTGFWIPKPFLTRMQQDGFMASGYVISEAFAVGNQIHQYTERRRYELNPDGSVTLGLVGYEAMVANHPERKRQ